MPIRAKLYIGGVISAGTALLVYAIGHFGSHSPWLYGWRLLLAVLASGMKVKLPGIPATMSSSYLFVLLAVIEFSLPETVLLASVAVLAQLLWKPRKQPRLVQAVFSISGMAVSAAGSWVIYNLLPGGDHMLPIRVSIAAVSNFMGNSLSVATVVALTERRSILRVWRESYFWAFPHYLVGAGAAVLVRQLSRSIGWQAELIWAPVVFFIVRSFRQHMGRLETEKRHAESFASLHLRTIEALALAIEAKDQGTNEHLRRVREYAVEIGRAMGLEDRELEALETAALLHDIGKLAVPEHIISKPGKLTAEEFEKMKIHPIVGAEILARVRFPYEVVPIVRAHHERWNGTGYPDGLKGEEICIGARILAVVDCLDALASDRPYRRGLPLDEAMSVIRGESGESFDARVVSILELHYREWESRAGGRAAAPRREVEETPTPAAMPPPAFVLSITAARQEAKALSELTQVLGTSLNLSETLSLLDSQLQALVPHEIMALYVRRDGRWPAEYVNGEEMRRFLPIEIAEGRGPSGQAAATGKTIVNGDPAAESTAAAHPAGPQSALAMPLTIGAETAAVLTLYRREPRAFTQDHLWALTAIQSKLAQAVENALKFHDASVSATTDGLTSLPNARSLFLRLESEVARALEDGGRLAVIVCDLDGFKGVNDRFGHLEGNRALRLVAEGLRSCCRESDTVARMGGDEFVLVLPGVEEAAVADRLEAIGQAVVEAGRTVCGEALLNVSAGAAFFPASGRDAESLLAEADRRMYAAKQRRKAAKDATRTSLAALADAVGEPAAAASASERPVPAADS